MDKEDLLDLKTNPVWDQLRIELQERLQGCIAALLELDHPKAVEARLIQGLLRRPQEISEGE